MKCWVVPMRKRGVNRPKWDIKQDIKILGWLGELVILDTRDEGISRQVKIARHTKEGYASPPDVLYDPQIVWLNEGRFTLAGFERVKEEGQTVHYAQSWLCIVATDQIMNAERPAR